MDISWVSVVILLALIGFGISVTGALCRIADATERSADALEAAAETRTGNSAAD